MATLTIRPSQIGIGYDYDYWSYSADDRLSDYAAFKWCRDVGINMLYCVLSDEITKRYDLGDELVNLDHEENWIQLNFDSDSDLIQFKLGWL